MTTKKHYASVSDLVQDAVPGTEARVAFDEFVACRRFIKQLMAMRAIKGISQKDLAEKFGCTQSRVSKLEGLSDNEIRLGDFRAYADAVDCDFVACIAPRDMTPVDKVKCHVFAIKKHMDDLAQLAKSDKKVAEGVAGFFFELFVNFTHLVGDSAKHLPLRPDDSSYFDLEISPFCLNEHSPQDAGCSKADHLLQTTR